MLQRLAIEASSTAFIYVIAFGEQQRCLMSARRSSAQLLTRDEARRIAANIAKLPEVLRRR